MKPLRSEWNQVAGYRVHHRVGTPAPAPSAPALVLLHGLGVSSRYFTPLAEALASKFLVYAPDTPGHGRSDRPRHTLDLHKSVDVLVRWMDHVGLDRAVLVGNSMGCQVAVEMAARYPSRVLAGVLISPTVDPEVAIPAHVGRLFLDLWRESFALDLLVFADYLSTGIWRTWREFLFALAQRVELFFPDVHAPMLVVRGERDPIVTQPWAEQVARALPKQLSLSYPALPMRCTSTSRSRLPGSSGASLPSCRPRTHVSRYSPCSSFPSVFLCFSPVFFSSGWRRVGGGVPSVSRASAFTALEARNGLGFFVFIPRQYVTRVQ